MERDILIDLRRHGKTIRAIAQELGVSTHQVNYWLKAYGLTTAKGRLPKDTAEKIVGIYLSTDASTREIAAIVGVSQYTVCKALVGIQKRKPKFVKAFSLNAEQLESVRGLSVHEASRVLGYPAMTIHRAMKRLLKS